MLHYAMLNENGECCAIVSGYGKVENLPELPFPSAEYGGKYYHDNQWWERIWDEMEEVVVETDADGNPVSTELRPVEGSTYTDIPWSAEIGEVSPDNT